MPSAHWIELAVALGCGVLASFLVAVETALTRFSRAQAESLVEAGAEGAERIRLIAADPAPAINAVMFARMFLEAVTMSLLSLVVFSHFGDTGTSLVLLVAILLVVFFILWGVAPRTLGRQHGEGLMRFSARLVSVLATVLGPVAQLMILLGNAITPGRGFTDGPFASEAELRDLVDMAEAQEVIEARESKMIHSVFELGDTLVKEVMVPRTDMVWVTRDRTLRQLLSLALRSGFSRIPVVGQGGIDDVLGVVYLKDVTRRIYDFPDAERTETVGDLMRPASFVPDSKPATELLRDMQLRHSHLVIVIDEFGGTAGLCTMEDIVEEIVGEIVDEYDHEIPAVAELPEEGQYRVSSRLPLDELGELFGIPLDDEEVGTVGGLMAKLLNVVPIPGSRVVHQGIEMVADRAVGRRHQVGTVLVRLADEDSDEERKEDTDD
ncbi:HlyC/CorC family transporter [Arachnia propionica]|uniref:HlyC/CorC family transporter n=1 Tax=Arachnia propionica TaxID=1750 RepID=A0A3P1TCW0_9ACTN|nr:hemolysin family protein [Arachnia propionica]MDO5081857.1 hemolysin family protein [Arachnia propionica]RRD07292.1 HlyC/CorC family transporter [Arachnia propionica]